MNSSDMNRYALMIEALTELAPEIEARRGTPRLNPPSLSRVLAENGRLPREALFLGVAADGLPVLLNLADPVPGPILIAGDEGSGKTAFLQLIARAVDQMQTPESVQYGVLTSHPDEWKEVSLFRNCVEIFASYENEASEFLLSMTSWAHSNHGEKQSVLLLIDDLGLINRIDFDARQNLRWLLLRGPARRVWPIVTVNPKISDVVQPWLDLFRTRFLGHVEDRTRLRHLSGSLNETLMSLRKGLEFAMPQGNEWLKFWIPTLD